MEIYFCRIIIWTGWVRKEVLSPNRVSSLLLELLLVLNILGSTGRYLLCPVPFPQGRVYCCSNHFFTSPHLYLPIAYVSSSLLNKDCLLTFPSTANSEPSCCSAEIWLFFFLSVCLACGRVLYVSLWFWISASQAMDSEYLPYLEKNVGSSVGLTYQLALLWPFLLCQSSCFLPFRMFTDPSSFLNK